jgi:excisionase family DNA binding protein
MPDIRINWSERLNPDDHPFLTVAEVATAFNTDPRTVRADILAGRIPAVPLGQSFRIPTRWVREHAYAEAS